MTTPSRGSIAGTLVAVLILGALSVWLQAERDRIPLGTSRDETLYLTRRATGRVVFTHRALASDLYWMRAIQYFGGRTKLVDTSGGLPPSFDLLYPLLDIATTLDPKFNAAYRFGAIFLSELPPHGPGRPDLAIDLLRKGLQVTPSKWEYWQDIGFVYYWNYHDYRKASEAFQRGAEVEGAPWWMRSMAATMLIKGGDRTTSRALWQLLYDTANNEYARNAARLKLLQLRALDEIEQLQAAYDRRQLRRLPNDPAGTPYVLNGTRIELASNSPLFPLPIEPGTGTGK